MTLAEIIRVIDSKRRVHKQELQEKASFDYTLADLIGRSVARLYSATNQMPPLEEAYSILFEDKDTEIQKQKKKEDLSVLRFKQFAQSYNQKFNQEVARE